MSAPIEELAARVCRLVEALPASPQQTELSLAASELRQRISFEIASRSRPEDRMAGVCTESTSVSWKSL